MTLNEQTYESFYIHHEESSLNPLIALETENFTLAYILQLWYHLYHYSTDV